MSKTGRCGGDKGGQGGDEEDRGRGDQNIYWVGLAFFPN